MLSSSCAQARAAWATIQRLPVLRELSSRPAYDQKGPNAGVIQALLKSRAEEEAKDSANAYKLRAFDTAVKAIDCLNFPINSRSAPTLKENIPGIGDGITRRIQEFIEAHDTQVQTSPAEKREAIKRQRAISELQTISGIGPVKARRLVNAGCMTLDDLRKPEFRNQLNRNSQTFLNFHDHLSVRVSRQEAEAVATFMKNNVLRGKWEMHLVGSYRRGGSSMSDIDILLFHEAYQSLGVSLKRLRNSGGKSQKDQDSLSVSLENEIILPLTQHGVIAKELTTGPTKWHGIARIPLDGESVSERLRACKSLDGRFKRLDICLAPMKSKGAALLIHTGDADYIRHVRRQATKAGMLLDENGLWQTSDPSLALSTAQEEELVLCLSDTEAIILQQIGLDLVEPGKRNFSNLRNKKSARKEWA